MKTDELIRAIAADRRRLPPVASLLARYLPAAVAFAALMLLVTVGFRPGLSAAVFASPRPAFKILASGALALAATGLALRLARPGAAAGSWPRLLMGIACAFAVAVIAELYVVVPQEWRAAMRGTNAAHCLMMIPALAFAPLVATLAALRSGAPDRPAVAGAAAGLLAGAFGATLYALHCPDDSPLFVATWYGLAILAVTACGAAAGSRVMRW